ncbi:MAG TPA: 5'-nucleotidase C-terminal domain-containing protein [Polyangia bacterium]
MRALVSIFALLAWTSFAGAAPPSQVIISVVGTSDLHGHIASLPWLAGYVENLRKARTSSGGAVILLDAGDMFQGTLESNLAEGAPVVRAYNALGYSAAAIGNHEFDFGPVGPAPSPEGPGDDPRGALKARAVEAHFPFLAANVVDRKTGKPVAWPNFKPSIIMDAAGIKVGLVGAITAATSHSALPANVVGLDFPSPAKTIAREARGLRARGAKVVIAVVHEGGACTNFAASDKLDSCDAKSEIFAIARALPVGSVDAIVAGHTHQAVAQRVGGVPIIQAYCNGRAFGRVDLTVDRKSGEVVAAHLDEPHDICQAGKAESCHAGDYEGSPVRANEEVVRLNAPAFAAAERKGTEFLNVEVLRPLFHNRKHETALGNLLADLMRASRPSDVAMINGGGMRAGLPAGPLSYGRLYETFPFDNAFASLRLPAREFRRLVARSLSHAGSLVSLSGLHVLARCEKGGMEVALTRPDGSPVHDEEMLELVTTDYLATGGDGFFAGANLDYEIGPPIRDAVAEALRQRGGVIDAGDRALFDPTHPRFALPGAVPIQCGH